MLKYDLIKLNNGLRVFIINRPGFESVDLTLYVRSASIYESKENNGISHLLEHLLFYNRKKTELYPFGLEIGASTRKDFSYYEALVGRRYFKEILKTFQKVVFEPDFDSKDLVSIKGRVKEEIKEGMDDPFGILNGYIDRHLYPDNPISFSILGSIENIDNLSMEDLKLWYQDYYYPENMILTVVGDIATDEVRKTAEELLKPPFSKNLKPKKGVKVKNKAKDKELILNYEKFERNYLALVYPAGKSLSSDFIDYAFLAALINQKLRPIIESSDLFYDLEFSYPHDLYRGEYQAITSSSDENLNKIKQMAIKEIEDMDFSEDFFKKTKEYFINNLVLKKDFLGELSFSTIYLLSPANELVKLDDKIRRAEKIKLSRIKKIKKNIFNSKNRYFFAIK